MRYLIFWGLFCLLFLAVGCNRNCGVKGRVVFSDDQTPLIRGTVCFVNEDGMARGIIDKNGYYVVGYTGKKDGLPRGSYKIYLADTDLRGSAVPANFPLPVYPQIEAKYADVETSGLTLEVKSSMTYNLELERFQVERFLRETKFPKKRN